MIEAQSLAFEHVPQQFEPLFCSMYLLDINSKMKMSETFYVNLNAPKLLQDFADKPGGAPTPGGEIDYLTMARSVLFSVQRAAASLYLILRIEKVARDDNACGIEPYLKSVKEKEFAKLIEVQ